MKVTVAGMEKSVSIGDYVTYLGPDSGVWVNGGCIRYTSSGWVYLDPASSENTDFYMRALNDVLEGTENERFNVLFARKIMSMEATIDELFAKFINFTHTIQSEATENGEPKIYMNGQTGVLKAIDSQFKNIVITNNSYFEGDIISGPLELTSINPSNLNNINQWAAGTSAQGVYNYFYNLQARTPVDGIYANIPFSNFELWSLTASGNNTHKYLAVFDKNWNQIEVPGGFNSSFSQNGVGVKNFICLQSLTNNNTFLNLSYNMQVGFYNPYGKTFKLINLPRNEPAVQYAIWVDSSGYLRIKM